jgi:O-antigen/teichoic acid export membrane protein
VSLKRNFSIGLLASIWASVLGFVMVPFYLKYLGIESYALIGFFTTTLTLLTLLDMGLSPTINREVARFSALGDIEKSANLLHTLSVVYWFMALFVLILIILLSPFVAEYWLKSNQFTTKTITIIIMLMGLVAASRWPVGLYQGALMGAQRQALSSYVNILVSTIGSLGAFLVLAFISPTIEAFFILQAFVGVIYALSMRWITWGVIGRINSIKFDVSELRRIWRFSAGVGLIGLTGLVLSQLDKIILSNMLGLAEFGYYMLATTVVSSLSILVTPLYNVIYPRFSSLIATGDQDILIQTYHLTTRLLGTVLFPIAMLLVFYSYELVFIWTNNADIASNTAPLISILALGSALHGVMYIPYALQLAYGLARLTLTISSFLVLLLFPLIIVFVLRYGAIGGAMAWLILHILYILLGPWLTHRSVLKGIGAIWLFRDVGVPLLITILISSLGYFLTKWIESPSYIKLLVGFLSATLAFIVSVSITPQLRSIVRNGLTKTPIYY